MLQTSGSYNSGSRKLSESESLQYLLASPAFLMTSLQRLYCSSVNLGILKSDQRWNLIKQIGSKSILIRIRPKKSKVKRCTLFQQNRSFHIIDRIHYSLSPKLTQMNLSLDISPQHRTWCMTHTLSLISIKIKPWTFKERKKRKPIIWFWIILLVFTVVRIVWRKFEWFELRCTTLITIELK